MIEIKQQETPIEAEKGITAGFDFASCLFGTMKLNEIETFDISLLDTYISTIFLESKHIRKYFPNVNGEHVIPQTVSLLEYQNEIVIINEKCYSKNAKSSDPYVEIRKAKLTFDEYTMDDLIHYIDKNRINIIEKLVLDFKDIQKASEEDKVNKLLEMVNNNQKIK